MPERFNNWKYFSVIALSRISELPVIQYMKKRPSSQSFLQSDCSKKFHEKKSPSYLEILFSGCRFRSLL